VSLLVIGAAVIAIPAASAMLTKFWNGFVALVVDMRTVMDPRIGVQPGPGGTVMFWFLAKKALGQSMPWIGLIAMLVTGGVAKGERRPIAMLLIFTAVMTLPYILLSWHGGSSSNMRYFLPVLPALSIICARIVEELWRSVPNAILFATAGVWAALALGGAWILLHPSGYVGIHQIVSTWVLLATAIAAIAAGLSWRFQQAARKLTIILFAMGLLISIALALSDFRDTQARRSGALAISKAVGQLPARSLIIAYPEWAATRIGVNDTLVADREPITAPPDPKLIRDALNAGYRVFVTTDLFRGAIDVPRGMKAVPTRYEYPTGRMIEFRRESPDAEPAIRR
jgi:hypothetical protein